MSKNGIGQVPDSLRHPKGTRIALSALFVVHWTVVGIMLFADPAGSLPRRLPARLGSSDAAVARALWPGIRPWLNVTSTRQHWMLFAPDPPDYVASVQAVASWGETPDAAPADTIDLPGAASDPFPHWTGHRRYLLMFHLVYERPGGFYRTVAAVRLCQRLRQAGREPEWVLLEAHWRPLDAPWVGTPRQPERRGIGVFRCDALLGTSDEAAPR